MLPIDMPVVQLFVAGVFAVLLTEVVKKVLGYTESDIGIHNSRDGQIIKARNATLLYAVVIMISDTMAFLAYEAVMDYAQQYIAPVFVEIGIGVVSVALIWLYLKVNHYSRS